MGTLVIILSVPAKARAGSMSLETLASHCDFQRSQKRQKVLIWDFCGSFYVAMGPPQQH